MKSFLSILVLVCFSNVQAVVNFCDTGKPHVIDIVFEMENAQTTVDMRKVQSDAYDRWDKELNKVYKELMGKLKTKDKQLLRVTQRAWITFRDAEADYYWSEAMYGGSRGTLAPIIVSDIFRGFLKDRVCQLMKFRDVAYSPNT